MPSEPIEIYSGIEELSKNRVFGDRNALQDSLVVFNGEGNTLYVEPNTEIRNSIITFDGNESLVYLSRTRHPYTTTISTKSNAIVYVGDGMYANPLKPFKIEVASNGCVLLGSRLLLSFGVEFDATHGDITINDYCWLGEEARVVGPVYLAGCSILGSKSLLEDAEIGPFSTVVGNGRKLNKKTIHSNDSIKNNGFHYKESISRSYADAIKQLAQEPSVPSINALDASSVDIAKHIAEWKESSSPSASKRIDLLSALDEGLKSIVRRKLFRQRKNNRIIGNPKQIDSQIMFNGSNNCLICSEGTVLKNCNISFLGDNGTLYLGKPNGCYDAAIDVSTDSTVVFMNDCEFRGRIFVTASEGRNVLVGEGCIFGDGCWIRTSDQHGVYDYERLIRTNPPKSTIIESACIIGKGCHILKGSYLTAGTVLEDEDIILGQATSIDTQTRNDKHDESIDSMLRLETELQHLQSPDERSRLALSLLDII